MTAAVREAVAAVPEPPRPPPRLGPAVVDPPHPATPPRVAPVAPRHTGWGYAIAWALGIGVGAIAAGAFVGFLVNGPPGHSSHRTIADVAPPTPDVPPPTPQEIVGSKTALATPSATTATAATPAAAAPATNAPKAPATAAGMTLPPIPPGKPAAQPAPPAPSSPPLSSADVREVQGRLRSLGFDPGPIDGSAGPRTAAAVTRYQEAHGLPTTGVADNDVLAELRREPGSTPPPPPPVMRPRPQTYQYAAAPPPRQSNPFLDALNRMFGR